MLSTRLRELGAATAVLFFASTIAFAPEGYVVMLIRSLMPIWALGLLALCLWAGFHRHWWLASTVLLGSVVALEQWMLPSFGRIQEVEGRSLRMVHLNVWQPNDSYEAVINSIRRSDADLVSVQEVSPAWAEAIRHGLLENYPYQIVLPSTNCYGIALLSRVPLRRANLINPAGADFIEAEVMLGRQAIRVITAHATSPTGYVDFQRRNAQLAFLAEHISRIDGSVVLIGDLNTVHWDDAYVRLCARGGLRPLSHPAQVTWPSVGPIALIPLDHALVKGATTGGRLECFDIAGSDHRGLMVELQVRHAS